MEQSWGGMPRAQGMPVLLLLEGPALHPAREAACCRPAAHSHTSLRGGKHSPVPTFSSPQRTLVPTQWSPSPAPRAGPHHCVCSGCPALGLSGQCAQVTRGPVSSLFSSAPPPFQVHLQPVAARAAGWADSRAEWLLPGAGPWLLPEVPCQLWRSEVWRVRRAPRVARQQTGVVRSKGPGES